MLAAILTTSGGRVIIPDAVDVVAGEEEEEVFFVDAGGRVIAVFQRPDIALFVEPDRLEVLEQYGNGRSTPAS